ncbi:MAG TPA: polysaccharide biosynthesis/export family protein [Pyrinomonadaceae bacterium]|nr:polysaccharide biosynthesis/export family protein [Pyrinomonadaceae bacterium]
MKNTSLVFLFLLVAVPAATAQTQIRARMTGAPSTVQENQNSSTRNRTVAPNNTPLNDAGMANQPKPAWGDSGVPVAAHPTVVTPPRPTNTRDIPRAAVNQLVKPTSLNVGNSTTARPAPATAPTSTYRVGIGDVLDIRLSNMATRESTLFTVMKNGVLEYPLLAKPLNVAGLTPDEIARRLGAEIKVIQNPRPSVSVRDYASHFVLITGAVDNPGRKVMRREAMPLFTLLAEALPRSDAATVTVVRNGQETSLSVNRTDELSMLVMPGDVIRVSPASGLFVYVGGEIAAAGEKELRQGMTLTQLLLAAGGVRQDRQFTAKISRRDGSGFLRSQDHNLKAIEQGKAADPLLQAGDRIEVRSGM